MKTHTIIGDDLLWDVYDALTSDRVYKKSFAHETVVTMIQNGA